MPWWGVVIVVGSVVGVARSITRKLIVDRTAPVGKPTSVRMPYLGMGETSTWRNQTQFYQANQRHKPFPRKHHHKRWLWVHMPHTLKTAILNGILTFVLHGKFFILYKIFKHLIRYIRCCYTWDITNRTHKYHFVCLMKNWKYPVHAIKLWYIIHDAYKHDTAVYGLYNEYSGYWIIEW